MKCPQCGAQMQPGHIRGDGRRNLDWREDAQTDPPHCRGSLLVAKPKVPFYFIGAPMVEAPSFYCANCRFFLTPLPEQDGETL
ncbi:MAG: PF20097 family protein [Faecalibacterium sp.]|nr:PF20097 family protein [Faecalibacterium sp.]